MAVTTSPGGGVTAIVSASDRGMIRSKLPVIRVFLVPYLILLLLFITLSGAGSTWLYFKARQAQSELLVQGLLQSVKPVLEQLSHSTPPSRLNDEQSLLHRSLNNIFKKMPGLEGIDVRSGQLGFHKYHNRDHELITENISKTEETPHGDLSSSTAAMRLYSESAPSLLIEFQINGQHHNPLRLILGFNRTTLRDTVGRAMSTLLQAISLFSILGMATLFIALAVTFRAVGQARNLEANVQELYRVAKSAELMAGLVHDLRNPLASFRANIASLRILPQETGEILTEMDRDLVRLDDKLSSMLDLTRQRNETLQQTDLEEVLAQVERLTAPVLDKQGIELVRHCQVSKPVLVMKNSLLDVLLNLVINAAESGQQGGIIELDARCKNTRLLLQVRDRGNGIPELSRIFNPFFTTKSKGHGLGLAICRRIIEAHNGTIQAENRAEGGAVFTIMLPRTCQQRNV